MTLKPSLQVQDVKLDDLTPAPWNPRLIKDKRFKELCESLKRDPDFLRLRPVLCTKDGTIYAGNQRYRAAVHLELPTVPTIVTDISEALAKERALKDNNQFGEWDDSLGQLLDELQGAGVPLEQLGFSASELESLLGSDGEEKLPEDEAPPLSDKPKAKLGDLWALGEHRLLCGDSTSPKDVARVCDGKNVDMVWVDPPYNVDYVGKTQNALKIKNDKMATGKFYEFLFLAFTAMSQNAKKGAPIYVAFAELEGINFRKALIDGGWELKQILIWVKNRFVLGRQDYNWQHEPIMYGWKSGEAHCWYGAFDKSTVLDEDVDLRKMDKGQLSAIIRDLRNARLTDIIRHDSPQSSEDHPTMKPVSLVGHMIRNSSRPEDTVLDTFGGSGSTLIACEHLRRRCRMIELDPRYCDVIVRRWETLTGEKAKKL